MMGGIRSVETTDDFQEFQREELDITGFGKKAELPVRIAISTLRLLDMKMTIVRVRGDPKFVWMEGIPVSFMGLDPKVYCDGQQRELRGIPLRTTSAPTLPGGRPWH